MAHNIVNTARENLIETVRSCPACGSTNWKQQCAPRQWIDSEHFATVKDFLGLSTCVNCKLVITNPRPGINLLTSFYDKPGYECHELNYDSAQESYAKARFSVVERHSPKGVLLDYGCGSGNMLRAALARGWSRVCGIEIGEKARHALLKAGLEVYPSLPTARSLRRQVDTVTMIQVLEHLVDPGTILKGVSEMLRPGGIFVVEVPNAGSLRAIIAGSALAGMFPRPVQRYQAFPIHLYHFEANQLRALLSRHGFRIIKLQTLGMGVEELWPRPLRGADAEVPVDSSPPTGGSTSPRDPLSLVVSGLKKAVKGTMSRLRWGEQLFAVCVRDT